MVNRYWIFVVTALSVLTLVLIGCVKSVEREGTDTPTSEPTTPTPTLTPAATPKLTSTVGPTVTATPTPCPFVITSLCEETATATPTSRPPTATPTPTSSPLTPTPQTSPTPGPEPTPTPGISGEIPAGLFLRITNLPKEGVVRTSTIPISGITDPDAVVSVNGVLVDVNSAGEFTSTVLLQPEPNLIEVVASDFQGNKVSAVLTIIYIP